MEQKDIERINELGRLSKERELTDAEREEQAHLRQAYLAWFRASLRGETEPKEKND